MLWVDPYMRYSPILLRLIVILSASSVAAKAAEELVIYDDDWNAPGSYVAQSALMPLLVSPNVKLLGLTTVTGDSWRDEGASSLLRYLEVIGVTDIPVANGAVFPLVNTRERMEDWERTHGFIYWKGAWNDTARFPNSHPGDPYKIPATADGAPHLQPAAENAAQFLIRMVHEHPHEVTIFAAGPLTNLALAISLDPGFSSLAKRLVIEGGYVGQLGNFDGFHSDFNMIFDPEAAHITLSAHWAKVVCLSDVCDAYILTKELLARVQSRPSAAGGYLARNSTTGLPLWEEVCTAYIADPSLATKSVDVTMDVDIDHGMSYGRTIVGSPDAKPSLGGSVVTFIQEIDGRRFIEAYVAAEQADVSRGPR